MKNTHTGILHGCDARTPPNYTRKVELRETKLYWVCNGTKYKKIDGRSIDMFPYYKLDLNSIKPR